MTATTAPTSPNILQRINAVRKALSYVQKNQQKIDHQYTATRYDDIVEHAHDLMVDNGIMVVTRALAGWEVVLTEQKTKNGAPYTRYQGLFETTFYNCDDPTDFIVSSAPGFGLDQGDKGAGKAHTYAVKTNLIKTLFIVTGDREEERVEGQGEDEVPTLAADVRLKAENALKAVDKVDDIQPLLKTYRKAIVAVAGEYEGHPDWVYLVDVASKRKGELAEAAK